VSCDHLLCNLSRIVIEVTINQQDRGESARHRGRTSQGANKPEGEPARIMELSFPRTFAPGNESSIDGTFALWNFRSQELSFHGTFVPTVSVTWFRSPTQIMII